MKEKPILFTAPMVRAILDGRKTQTRRVAKPRFDDKTPCHHWAGGYQDGTAIMSRHCEHGSEGLPCPYGQPGDRLWVRETWRAEELDIDSLAGTAGTDGIRFRADGKFKSIENTEEAAEKWCAAYANGKHMELWRPSIFMPRWASRITLELTGVRVERLQDITRNDAIAEGVFLNENDYWTAGEMEHGKVLAGLDCPQHAYGRLWEYINGPGSWLTNPWLWVLEFKRI